MVVLSKMGVYVIEDVNMKGYIDIPIREDKLNISSSNIYFLGNGEKFVGGYEINKVILSSF